MTTRFPGDQLIEPIDARPFIEWVERRVNGGGLRKVADGLGVDASWLAKGAFHRTGLIERAAVENMFDHAGVRIQDVYDGLDEDFELEPDGFCDRCHEIVTPIAGCCPWCNDKVDSVTGYEKGYCATCDALVARRRTGGCWRCGSGLRSSGPYDPCGCGCGVAVHRFDWKGRRVRYVRGHAPRSLEQDGQVDNEPFALYLEERLAKLDPIAALAREHGISRRDVLAVLQRHEKTVSRALVRRALWIFGTNGKGMPRRPDSTSFFDLYPGDKRAKTCPGCGKGKAPHAELCKQCRKRAKAAAGRSARDGDRVEATA